MALHKSAGHGFYYGYRKNYFTALFAFPLLPRKHSKLKLYETLASDLNSWLNNNYVTSACGGKDRKQG